MKHLCTIMLLLIIFLVTSVVSAVNITTEQSGTNEATHFFLQEATSGSYEMDDSGNYTLTLTGVKPDTIYFTDRPSHDIGFVSIEKYLDGFNWNPENPPNAVLIIKGNEENVTIIGVELTSPKYDADLNLLTYLVKPMENVVFESDWISALQLSEKQTLPETFGNVILLIDDCPCVIVNTESCQDNCRNSCWNHGKCEPCGGCCYSSLLCQ